MMDIPLLQMKKLRFRKVEPKFKVVLKITWLVRRRNNVHTPIDWFLSSWPVRCPLAGGKVLIWIKGLDQSWFSPHRPLFREQVRAEICLKCLQDSRFFFWHLLWGKSERRQLFLFLWGGHKETLWCFHCCALVPASCASSPCWAFGSLDFV